MRSIILSLLLTAIASTAFSQISSQSQAGIILSSAQTIQGVPACDGVNDLIDQPLGAFSTARTADAEFGFETREDRTVGGVSTPLPTGNLGATRIWGLSLEFDPAAGFVGPCSDDDATGFVITTYQDNAGQPGAVVSSGTASASVTDTGTPFALGANILLVDLFPTAAIATGSATWLGFQRNQGNDAPSGNACVFLHINETDASLYDNVSTQFDSTTDTINPDDLTLCASAGAVLPPPPVVPTMNSFGLLAMALALMLGAGLFLRRRV